MHRLVSALDAAGATRSRKAKVKALAEALRGIAADGEAEDVAVAVRLVSGFILPLTDGRPLGVGFSIVADAACSALAVSREELARRARSFGDLGDAIGDLAAAAPEGAGHAGLSIAEVARLGAELASSNDRGVKVARLTAAYRAARPGDAKYLTKMLLNELRIGVREGIVEEAIALAFEASPEEVHRAALLTVDPGALAVLALHHELEEAVFTLGAPIASMLAAPTEAVQAPLDPATTVWEDKLDGIRVQVHARPGWVQLFSRGKGDVTPTFPELTRAFEAVDRPIVLDGEILAVAPGDAALPPRPFQALQARLNRRDPDASVLASTPVALFAFDLLFDTRPLLEEPWATRHERLVALFRDAPFTAVARVTRSQPFDPGRPLDEQIDAAFAEARGRGHEGLVLKDTTSRYEAGRRGGAWRKVKRALATLDVVITKAERGHGRRAKVLSDYTFAVWKDDALVDIGKAYSGLTDAEILTLTTELEALTIAHEGRFALIAPKVVLEVGFDGIQPSKRHASGFALRFPRILRIRDDKTPRDADTLATAEALFQAQVATGHREEEPPPLQKTKTPKPDPGTKQLSLFAPSAPGAKPKKR